MTFLPLTTQSLYGDDMGYMGCHAGEDGSGCMESWRSLPSNVPVRGGNDNGCNVTGVKVYGSEWYVTVFRCCFPELFCHVLGCISGRR